MPARHENESGWDLPVLVGEVLVCKANMVPFFVYGGLFARVKRPASLINEITLRAHSNDGTGTNADKMSGARERGFYGKYTCGLRN